MIAETVRSVADRLGLLPAQVALAWVYAQSSRLGLTVVPIPGTRNVSRLEQNAAAVEIELDPAALEQLQPLSDLVAGGRYPSQGVR